MSKKRFTVQEHLEIAPKVCKALEHLQKIFLDASLAFPRSHPVVRKASQAVQSLGQLISALDDDLQSLPEASGGKLLRTYYPGGKL